MNEAVITLENIAKKYKIYAHPQDRLRQMLQRSRCFFSEHEALKPLSLTINHGETVGIVGTNGSGKSTLLQMICGTLTPSHGTIHTQGRISALLELGAGFNPDFSGRENIWLNATILGLSHEEIKARYEDIVAFSGLHPDYMERPVKTYSSGMYVRLAFAVAIAVDPDILIVDEALAVGDESFQRKCFARIRHLQESGKTILFVSHAANTITDLCSRALLLDNGELLLDGAPKEIISSYHRMIFAPEEKRALMRQEIIDSNNKNERIAPPSSSILHDTTPEITNEFPETRIEYPSQGAIIENPQLLNAQGNPIHVLTYGQTYHFHYRIRMTEDAENIRAAMLIKTRTGLELTGALCPLQSQNIASAKTGDIIEVRFSFPCHLAHGVYFFNCGVTVQQDGQDIFLHRIVDAWQCRVLPSEVAATEFQSTGLAHIGITCHTETIKVAKTDKKVYG